MTDDRILEFLPNIESAVGSLCRSQHLTADERGDLVQTCVLRFLQDPGLLTAIVLAEYPQAYAYTIASNFAKDALKSARAQRDREGAIELQQPSALPGGVTRSELREALSKLPAEEMALLSHLFFEDPAMSEDEVAAHMHHTRAWVRTHRDTAFAKLKQLLPRREKCQ